MLNPVVVAGGGDPWADADAGAARGWDLHRHRGGEEEAAWGGEEELEPYCNFCFARKFKISAINIADTVNIVPEEHHIMSLWSGVVVYVLYTLYA